MSQIVIGEPPGPNTTANKRNAAGDLIHAAIANRGQWVSSDKIQMGGNTYGNIYRATASALGVKIAKRGDTVYLYVPE